MSTSMNEMEQTISGLFHQIFTDEILVRLPVKSLCRFKTVSKLWNAVISSHKFAKSHLHYNKLSSNFNWVFFQVKQNSWLLNCEASDHHDKDPLALSFDEDYTAVQSVSLGNILNLPLNRTAYAFGSSCGLVSLLTEDGKICICNPILRQLRIIDGPYPFDIKMVILCGFGNVSSKDDFKLVFASREQLHQIPTVFIFSILENIWREIQGSHPFHILSSLDLSFTNGILINERLHWTNAPTKDDDEFDCHFFAFDLLHEVFEEIPIPEELSSKLRCTTQLCYTSTIGGSLGAWTMEPGSGIGMWVQKRYGQTHSWVQLSNDNFREEFIEPLRAGVLIMTEARRLLGLWNEYNQFYFFTDRIQFPAFECLRRFGEYRITSIVDYVGSLVSPFGLMMQTPQEMKEELAAGPNGREH